MSLQFLRKQQSVPRRSAFGHMAFQIFAILILSCGDVLAQTAEPVATAEESTPAPTVSKSRHRIPAEESRLSAGVFREGLKRRGLTEVLELHVRVFPTNNPIDVLLMSRDVKLAEFSAAGKLSAERREAIAEANRILQEIITDFPDDARHLEWQYTLLNSFLYDEAAPYVTNLLAGLGGEGDRSVLATIAEKALVVAREFSHAISAEYIQIDALPAEKFDALERSGFLETLDKYAPASDYLLVWSLFYDVLGRRPEDPEIAGKLNEIVLTFEAKPAMLQAPHVRSHIQVQSLLLAGMTQRRLNDHARARTFLDRARAEADNVADAGERQRLQWAVTLIEIESIANERDDNRIADAESRLGRLRELPAAKEKSGYTLRLTAAMLQRSVDQTLATAAESSGHADQAVKFRDKAIHDLSNMLIAEPESREELLAAVDRATPKDADIGRLDAIERLARVWALTREADRATAPSAGDILSRAIEIGESLVSSAETSARDMIPEAMFLLGTAYFKHGDLALAAKQFLSLATSHPKSDRASRAAALATQLSHDALNMSPQNADLISLHKDALKTLITTDANSEAAKYWRFRYAQVLDEAGDFSGAALLYSQVTDDHPQHMEAMFRQVLALAHQVRRVAGESPAPDGSASGNSITSLVASLNQAADAFDGATRTQLQASPDDARRSALLHLVAEARLAVAEVEVLPSLAAPTKAIERLAGFESTFPTERSLFARLWVTRFRAFDGLGRATDAKKALVELTKTDPAECGKLLQSLYTECVAEGDRLHRTGKKESATHCFVSAALLADALVAWAEANPSLANKETSRALNVQLAEASLAAGRLDCAKEIFERELSRHGTGAAALENAEPRVLIGYAETHFQLGNFATALPAFNRLATRLPAEDATRWLALLRDLQCRTRLGEPPDGILKVLDQQRRLHPDLGGLKFSPQFDSLKQENETRLAHKS
ncbi:MAG: tetratricopeptide repeat protein [Planctomycetes bacterium]|nr:tetratricopeptide repeat protein [Planctomycetota bacterium]MBI3833818.1 tetratricopeptide repeat protein [Planctomycetota bacterium]